MSGIVLFEVETQQDEVRLENEPLWIIQARMAGLFDVQKVAVIKYLRNIYTGGDLDKSVGQLVVGSGTNKNQDA